MPDNFIKTNCLCHRTDSTACHEDAFDWTCTRFKSSNRSGKSGKGDTLRSPRTPWGAATRPIVTKSVTIASHRRGVDNLDVHETSVPNCARFDERAQRLGNPSPPTDDTT